MASAAKHINKMDMTSTTKDAGANESPSSAGPHAPPVQRTGPKENDRSGWKGGYDDHTWMGNPADIKDRQWADHGGPGYFGGDNIVYPENEVEADIYMVPDFQEQSGQGANQSTLRPIGSV